MTVELSIGVPCVMAGNVALLRADRQTYFHWGRPQTPLSRITLDNVCISKILVFRQKTITDMFISFEMKHIICEFLA
jgi:hypothetical protein